MGRVHKERIGVRGDQKIPIDSFESICNPITQALLLNQAKTDFNILMGLCVGHDSLFLKYAEDLCTVLAGKDRLLGHNPLATIRAIDGYYRSVAQGAEPTGVTRFRRDASIRYMQSELF